MDKFQLKCTIQKSDIDVNNHVNNIVYLRWVQEAAVAHWKSATTPEEQQKVLWVVKRHEIDYKQAVHLGDEVIACTWVGNASELVFERYTEILVPGAGTVVAKAKTLWVPVSRETGRPVRIDNDLRARFSENYAAKIG